MDYSVVYANAVNIADTMHRAIAYLATNGRQLTFNGTQIAELQNITFPEYLNSSLGGKKSSTDSCSLMQRGRVFTYS